MPSYLIKDSRCLSCFLVLLFYPPSSLSLSLPGLSCLVCADLKNNYSFWKRDWQTGRKQRMGLKGAFPSLRAQGFVWSWSPWNSFQLLLLLLFDLKGRLIRNFFCACVRLLTAFLALFSVFLWDSFSLSASVLFSHPVWLSESVKIVLLDLINLEGVSTRLQVRSDDRSLCLLLSTI